MSMNPQKILLGIVELSRVDRTFNTSPLPIEEIVQCEDGSETQYWVGIKNIFNITFENLPAADINTLDGMAGRNSLKAKYDLHAFFVMTLYDEAGVTKTYTVRFASYSEEALRPWTGDSDWRYNISFTLKET